MRAIGFLQFGQGKDRSGMLLSQFDEPCCLNVLRQLKQAKCTLFVAVGIPAPLRIPATMASLFVGKIHAPGHGTVGI